MTKAKGRKNLTDRRGFVALALAALGASVAGPAIAQAPAHTVRTPPPKGPAQRARLPRRLAADFHGHIETRLPHLRAPFEAAARETGIGWRMLAALAYQESRWRPAA